MRAARLFGGLNDGAGSEKRCMKYSTETAIKGSGGENSEIKPQPDTVSQAAGTKDGSLVFAKK